MNDLFAELVARLSTEAVRTSRVIPWSSPVPVFGNVRTAHVATLGLNPSNREFVDEKGIELDGAQRRFHTLRSLGLSAWKHARGEHMRMLVDSCLRYFVTNPYDGWFRRLENIIGTRASFYGATPTACHLDLIPY